MAGGGTRERVIQTTAPAEGRVLPEFQPYAARVGQLALEAINQPGISLPTFAAEQPFPTPGLAPLQQAAVQRGADRFVFGIPVPGAEQLAFQHVAGQPFQKFIQGNVGDTPAVRSAVQGLENQIVPRVQNEYARMGLANAPILPQEIGRSYARELVPLYQQGMWQQQKAADAATQRLLEMGQREEARPLQTMREAIQLGDLQRQVEAERRAAAEQAFLRRREMALGLTNPFGSFSSIHGIPPSVLTERRQTPTGLGFGK